VDTTHIPDTAGDPEPGARSAPSVRPPGPAASRGWPRAAGLCAAAAAATAVCGIPAGFIWAAVAPRALVQVISQDTVAVVNAETGAFIAADLWFCLIGVAGGLLTGAFGYGIVTRRGTRGPAAAAGLILGALAAAAIARWIGGLDGHAAFLHQLAASAPGTRLHQPLTLGATSGLVFWPLATAFAIVVIDVAARWHAARHPEPRALADARRPR
jgi:hypothetical protein